MKPLFIKKNGTVSKVSGIIMPASYPANRVTLTNGSTVEGIIGKASGSGLANSLVYREEITSITADMWTNIANGSFKGLHAGMHYTAPSGRTYWFADADYFLGIGNPEQTEHHMLVIEDNINHTAAHHTSGTTSGGAAASDIYTTTLPAYQSELETDFGASHIKSQNVLLTTSTTSWSWASKDAMLMNARMVYGNPICSAGSTGEMYNGGIRMRQLSLFRAIQEATVARTAGTTSRAPWWLDDVESSSAFGYIDDAGGGRASGAANVYGIRRAFIIG